MAQGQPQYNPYAQSSYPQGHNQFASDEYQPIVPPQKQWDEKHGDVEMGRPYSSAPSAVPYDAVYQSTHENMMYAQMRIKVYVVLSIQIAVTALFSCLCMFYQPLNDWLARSPRLAMVGPILCLVLLLGMRCGFCGGMEVMRKHPHNIAFLSLFTFLIGSSVGAICGIYAHAGLAYLVLEAFLLTMGAFIGLTAYAVWSKTDFSFLGGMLNAGLWIMIMFGLLRWFLPLGNTLNLIYCGFGILLFCGYILYDTDRLMNKKNKDGGFSVDDWAWISFELYLDVVNLFLYILEFLQRSRS